MTRFLNLLLLAVFAAFAPAILAPADAQKSASVPQPMPGISTDQARAALDTLNDPKKRAAFAATLEALLKGQAAGESPAPSTPEAAPDKSAPGTLEGITIPLAPNSLGAQVLLTASSFVTELGDEAVRAVRTLQSLPLLWAWLVVMVTNPLGQRLLLDASWRLAVALALGTAARLALRYSLRRPTAKVLLLGRQGMRMRAVDPDPLVRAEQGEIEPPLPGPGIVGTTWKRVRLGLARLALEILPVLAFALAGHLVAASSLGGQDVSRLVILAVIDAVAVSETLLAVATFVFMPDPPGLKLFAISPALGFWLMRWSRRLILIAVPGYTFGEVGLLLGLSAPAHDALQKTVGLALLICLSIMIVQRRRRVRVWLSAPPDAVGALARLRDRVARYWYFMALFFLWASWLTWTLRAPDAIAQSLWYCFATAAVLIAASVARLAVGALIARLEPEPTEGPDYSVRARLNVYHAPVRVLARLAINVLAFLGLLQLFGLGGLTWLLASDVGHRILSGIVTLTVTIALAFAVWEIVNLAIQRHLERLRRESQAARSARLRTLLPLVHTALAITIVVVAGLMVLSEIGVNIAPLLAGAGIVGVAIGFGSQKLVQDVITGVFLLLENTMQVGDVVRVGDQVGFVESLSVRTIRLRTEDGSVVVMPFSAVTTVVNMTRDFSRAVIAVSVATDADVDHVIETMRAIVKEMREEEAWSTIILDELEVWGLDKFTDSALQIKCRIMCTPFGRWPVGREFNRRMKQRFQDLGIEMPYPHLKLVLEGHASAAGMLPEGKAASAMTALQGAELQGLELRP